MCIFCAQKEWYNAQCRIGQMGIFLFVLDPFYFKDILCRPAVWLGVLENNCCYGN